MEKSLQKLSANQKQVLPMEFLFPIITKRRMFIDGLSPIASGNVSKILRLFVKIFIVSIFGL